MFRQTIPYINYPLSERVFSPTSRQVAVPVSVLWLTGSRCTVNWTVCALHTFYRAIHYITKRGLAIACRPSVHLSVCLSVMLVDCDHTGWKSRKLIQRTQPDTFALRNSKAIHLIAGEHEILGRPEVGWEKVACWNTKETAKEKLLWMSIGTLRRSFERYHPDPFRP